jgi:hypothetical protein
VEVQTGDRGGVGDPEGGADGPADAVVCVVRGRGVTIHDPEAPAAVDEAVEDSGGATRHAGWGICPI